MNDSLLLSVQVGADSIFNNMGSSLRGGNGTEWTTLVRLLAFGCGVLLAIGFAVYMGYRLVRFWRNTPTGLFWRLSHAHALTWGERWLLWRVTRWLMLAEPAEIFVEPACIEHAASLWTALGERLFTLRDRLFAVEEPRHHGRTTTVAMVPENAPDPRPAPPAFQPPAVSDSVVEGLALDELMGRSAGLPLEWTNFPPGRDARPRHTLTGRRRVAADRIARLSPPPISPGSARVAGQCFPPSLVASIIEGLWR